LGGRGSGVGDRGLGVGAEGRGGDNSEVRSLERFALRGGRVRQSAICNLQSAIGLILLLLLTACQVGGSAPAAPAPFYNPLNSLMGADPWLQFHEGNYYLTATQWSDIRMWKSPTLGGLASAAPVTIWSDSDPSRCCNVWAPEFHLLEGPNGPRWYVYYTAGSDGTLDNQRMHVLESEGTDPLGPYTYKGRIFDPANDGWAIDGSVLKLDDRLYYLFSSWVGPDQSMFIAPMSDPWTISGPRVLLSKPTHIWERMQGNVNEGPEVLQRDGKTFIIYSASACWGPDYKLGMLTYAGGDPLSEAAWEKHPEPVFARSDGNGVYAPGHNGFFTSPDGAESWIVYHANSSPGDGCTGERTTRVQPFSWNEDGTPNFGEPLALDTPIDPPSGERPASVKPAPAVRYTLVSRADERCLGLTGGAAGPELQPCDQRPGQQWRLDYLANGYYRLTSGQGGQALTVTGEADGAALEVAAWAYGAEQQWRVLTAQEGWLRLEARHSGLTLGCAEGGSLRQAANQPDDHCQQFRLQPVDAVKLVNANSNKPLGVAQSSADDGAAVLLWRDAGTAEQRWRFAHQADGFYQIVAGHSNKCLGPGADGAALVQGSCAGAPGQQWRIEPLNDGMLRLVNRDGARVIDVSNCRMGDGTTTQLWSWLDNMCQRFYFAAP
jgi:GH43 family beta-xylosidase